MGNSDLLRKAREILTHTNPKFSPGPTSNEVRDNTLVSEPAAPHARPIFWETGEGRILGPATPEFLGKSGGQFWIVTTFEVQIRWINADRLRSKKAFETQRAVYDVELI
ncbi:MAG: hypothetical protein U0223_08245 [Nitrospira sp.]